MISYVKILTIVLLLFSMIACESREGSGIEGQKFKILIEGNSYIAFAYYTTGSSKEPKPIAAVIYRQSDDEPAIGASIRGDILLNGKHIRKPPGSIWLFASQQDDLLKLPGSWDYKDTTSEEIQRICEKSLLQYVLESKK